ncbi:MAG: 50S ribosomal protein L25 [Bacteroidales bacterium]|nr:50S ribosomal protein L25 [Bacteroidales bacterium]
MNTVSLSGSLRENVGKKDAKLQRKLGKVPCVIYGGSEQKHFTLDQKDFKSIVFTPEIIIAKITLGDKTYESILQDIQYHPVSDEVLHADFLELNPEKPVTIALPIELKGTAPGVVKGGKLRLKMRKLRVKGLIHTMPEHVVIDISKLDVGRTIKVRDIKNTDLTFLEPGNLVIVSIAAARGVTADVEEEQIEAEGTEGGEESAE